MLIKLINALAILGLYMQCAIACYLALMVTAPDSGTLLFVWIVFVVPVPLTYYFEQRSRLKTITATLKQAAKETADSDEETRLLRASMVISIHQFSKNYPYSFRERDEAWEIVSGMDRARADLIETYLEISKGHSSEQKRSSKFAFNEDISLWLKK